MAGPIDLPDVNVWLAFSVADHPHHQRARSYWYEESGDELVFCRVTALAFLRLATNATVMGGQPLTVSQAWEAYSSFRRLPEVALAAEPEGCEDWLGQWALENGLAPRQWDRRLSGRLRPGGRVPARVLRWRLQPLRRPRSSSAGSIAALRPG